MQTVKEFALLSVIGIAAGVAVALWLPVVLLLTLGAAVLPKRRHAWQRRRGA